MKKFIFIGTVGLFLLGSCMSKSGDGHEHHNHETEVHSHEHEGHSHEHEGHDHEHEDHTHEHEGHDHEHEGHDHEHEGHTHEGHAHSAKTADSHSDEIILPPAKAQAAGVKTGVIEPGTFHQVIKTSGQVMAAQGDESVAVATVAGVVSSAEVIEGMSVSKGTPLVTLSSKNMVEGDPVERARIAYEVSKKEYERMKALIGNKIVSEKEFAQAEQAYENARISYEAVAKNNSQSGQAVTSPIGGYVKDLLVKEGDYVTVGQPLVSITQNRRLFLRADVSEKYYPYLRTIGSANFCTPYNNKVYALSELNGRLLSYGKASGGGSGYYVPVTFEFDNKGDIVPGSFVEVYLLSSPMENVIALPRSALTEEQGSFFVYLQLDEEGYKKQLVTLGADNGESVQILSGVKAGDRVVTEGAYQVKLASATNAIPAHSHEH